MTERKYLSGRGGKKLLDMEKIYKQIDSGRSIDEVAKEWGVRKTKGVGKKTAEAILEGQTPQGMYKRVSEAYRAYYGHEKKSFTTFRGDVVQWDWMDHLNERFQLLRLRRDVLHPVGHVKDFLKKRGVVV